MVPERHPSLCKQDEAYEALLFAVCQRWPTWPCLWRAHEEMDEKGRWQWCHHRLDLLCTLLALSLAVGMLTLEHWELKVMIPGSLVSNSLPNLCLWGSQGRIEDQCATPPPSSMSPLINFEFMFVRMSFLTFCLFCLHCTYFLFLSLNKFFFILLLSSNFRINYSFVFYVSRTWIESFKTFVLFRGICNWDFIRF